jgi:hypothetical protein
MPISKGTQCDRPPSTGTHTMYRFCGEEWRSGSGLDVLAFGFPAVGLSFAFWVLDATWLQLFVIPVG